MIFREVEDRDLIAKARRGHVEAYNVLVSRWEKRVFNYLLRLVGQREDALDLSQDVFLKAYQNLKKLDDPAKFPGWLFRIAHNEAYSLLRKNRPEGEMTVEPKMAEASGGLFPIESTLAVRSALETAVGRSSRGSAAQGLSGIQVRGDGGDSFLSRLHREIPPVHRARSSETDFGSY